jgi:hypothetical protein
MQLSQPSAVSAGAEAWFAGMVAIIIMSTLPAQASLWAA